MLIMQPKRESLLLDKQQRLLGHFAIDQVDSDLLSGTFTAESAFTEVAPLFRAFEDAVELQALRTVDDLDHAIADMGLYLQSPTDQRVSPVHDVQIYSDGGMTCRLTRISPTPANGMIATHHAAHPVTE
jgi:hypothetical protein